MNLVCLQIFDVNRSKNVTSHFLNMCLMSDKNASTAVCIFDKLMKNLLSMACRGKIVYASV